VRPRRIARTSALDVVFRLGDYLMLTGCVAMTIIVGMGLRHAGPAGFKFLHDWPKANTSFERVLSLRDAMRFYPLPAPPPAAPGPAQETVIARPVSTVAKEVSMSPSQLIDRWNPIISEASRRFGVSAGWIKAVMDVETGGRTVSKGGAPITSHAGALGIMQLMPKTYQAMRAQYRLGANPFNTRDNVMAGAAYLHTLYQRYGFPNMFAAYNAGPGKLEDHLEKGAPLPDETVHYVASVTRDLGDATTPEAPTREGRHRNLTRYAVRLGGRHHRLYAWLRG
jgi:soluble lytic murein transglycosylase-like protein